MFLTLDEIGQRTLGKRCSFSNSEIGVVMSFLEHMQKGGRRYLPHPCMISDPESFTQEGYMMIHTDSPALGILLVKIESGRGFFGQKKYSYQMYLDKDSEMDSLKKHTDFPVLKDALVSISVLRDGMKI